MKHVLVVMSLLAALLVPPIPSYPTTDGDILATAVINVGTTHALAIGGSFTRVGGTPAHNLAIIRIPDGRVLYAGNTDSYVRALYVSGTRLYVGGNFSHISGTARHYIASLVIPTWRLTPFNPTNGSSVYAISAVSGSIVFGGGGPLRAAVPDGTTVRWELPVLGGTIRALLADCGTPGSLYVGGLFEQVGSLVQHGLVRLDGQTINRTFAPVLHTDRLGYDGQEVLSLGCKQPDAQLMVGWGGSTTNGIGAMTRDTGRWWWWRNTAGDLQAIAVTATSTYIGTHRNHQNTVPGETPVHGEDGQKFYLTELNSSYGNASSWDPRLAYSGAQADRGGGGVQALAYDPVSNTIFAGGGFYGTASCSSTVWPCTATLTPRRSLAAY